MTQIITGKTELLGVIGDPVRHSFSPIMHNAALGDLGANYVYVAFPIKTADLSTAIEGLRAIDVQGFNVTIPHKQGIMPLLQSITPEAAAVGAVNTVWRTDQGWAGTNTDVRGFLEPLQEVAATARANVVILGNGGAARAVVAACSQWEVPSINVVGRNPKKLEQFHNSWRMSPMPALSVHTWDTLQTLLPRAELVVNTTPVGMSPAGISPLSEAEMDMLPSNAIVYDLIYNPAPTKLLHMATARELKTLDGLEMLIRQGAAALEIWLQQPAPIDMMRQALKQHLGHPLSGDPIS
jgi:shikimate dehydrogenase